MAWLTPSSSLLLIAPCAAMLSVLAIVIFHEFEARVPLPPRLRPPRVERRASTQVLSEYLFESSRQPILPVAPTALDLVRRASAELLHEYLEERREMAAAPALPRTVSPPDEAAHLLHFAPA